VREGRIEREREGKDESKRERGREKLGEGKVEREKVKKGWEGRKGGREGRRKRGRERKEGRKSEWVRERDGESGGEWETEDNPSPSKLSRGSQPRRKRRTGHQNGTKNRIRETYPKGLAHERDKKHK